MIVDIISEPEDVVDKGKLHDAVSFLEEMDVPAIAAVEVVLPKVPDILGADAADHYQRDGAILCVILREVGGVYSSHIAVPLRTDLAGRQVIEQHVKAAAERIPKSPEPWPDGFAEMAEKPPTPKVGVGVMVCRNLAFHSGVGSTKHREVLLGMRKGSHGAGEWSFPGGHLELGESPETCAKRELMEETGISIKKMSRMGWSNDVMPEEGLHYVTLFLGCDVPFDTKVDLREPDKTEGWRWFPLDRLPHNIFAPTAQLLSVFS
jgi:8-oxo-dGTP diphosphatase